jgi:plastocyanin
MPFTSDQPRRQVVSTRRPALLIVVGAVAALLLAACGSDTPSDTGGTSPSPEETSTSTPEAGKATTIEVSETEFAIKLSKSSVPAGDYTFAIANDGQFPHNLAIKGPGIDGQTSETFPGGKSGELTVTLQKGTYTVWCGVGNHRAQGMETKLEVTE